METNINSDLGEKSQHSSTANDPALLAIINTANVACGYHAGDQETIENTIQIAKKIMLVLPPIHRLKIEKILVEKGLIYLGLKLGRSSLNN